MPWCFVDGKFRAITLFDGTVEISGQMTIICDPEIHIYMLKERCGHQTENIFAIYGNVLLNGPEVHVLSSGVDVSTQTRDERLHRRHQQHIFEEEQIEFKK